MNAKFRSEVPAGHKPDFRDGAAHEPADVKLIPPEDESDLTCPKCNGAQGGCYECKGSGQTTPF